MYIYISIKGIDNISEEEKDDFTIKATDSILVAAKLVKKKGLI
jgi:hypothetical protein